MLIVRYESKSHAETAAFYFSDDYPSKVITEEHERIAASHNMTVTESTIEATEKIIELAPEMLLTLKNLVAWAETQLTFDTSKNSYIDGTELEFNAAKAIIAAATKNAEAA